MSQAFWDIVRAPLRLPGLEQLWVWVCNGRWYGDSITKLAPKYYGYSPGTHRQVTRDGVKFALDIHDFIDWEIYFGFREHAREALLALVKPGTVMLDVGTNVGTVIFRAALQAGAEGHVFGFEPHPTNWARLQRNRTLNPEIRNITLSQLALGPENGTAPMAVDDPANLGRNRIVKAAAANNAIPQQIIDIPVRRMDDEVKRFGLTQLDIVKIDTEGFEMQVLLGAEETLRQFKPVLFIEIDDANLRAVGDSAAGLIGWLNAQGYEAHHAETQQRITPDNAAHSSHYDILARPGV
jgi:FkbM family methyltransferase